MRIFRIRTGLLSLLLISALSACQLNKDSWKLVLTTQDLKKFGVNLLDGHLGVVEKGGWRDDHILYLDPDDPASKENIYPESPLSIDHLCIADKIWIDSAVSGDFFSYDLEAKTWASHPGSGDSNGYQNCFVTPNNKLIFWKGNRIDTYDRFGNVDTTILPELEVITDFYQNAAGNLWLLTVKGEVFRHEGEQWLRVLGDLDFPLSTNELLVSSEGEIWIAAWRKLYLLQVTGESFQNKSVLELSNQGWFQELYQDSDGRIWIISTEGIWIYASAHLQKLPLPKYDTRLMYEIMKRLRPNGTPSTVIANPIIDYPRERLFVSTFEGIYSLDMADIKALGIR